MSGQRTFCWLHCRRTCSVGAHRGRTRSAARRQALARVPPHGRDCTGHYPLTGSPLAAGWHVQRLHGTAPHGAFARDIAPAHRSLCAGWGEPGVGAGESALRAERPTRPPSAPPHTPTRTPPCTCQDMHNVPSGHKGSNLAAVCREPKRGLRIKGGKRTHRVVQVKVSVVLIGHRSEHSHARRPASEHERALGQG